MIFSLIFKCIAVLSIFWWFKSLKYMSWCWWKMLHSMMKFFHCCMSVILNFLFNLHKEALILLSSIMFFIYDEFLITVTSSIVSDLLLNNRVDLVCLKSVLSFSWLSKKFNFKIISSSLILFWMILRFFYCFNFFNWVVISSWAFWSCSSKIVKNSFWSSVKELDSFKDSSVFNVI